jgi:hypothetical protein
MVKRTGSDCRERSASVADYLHGYKRIALTALKPWDNNPRTHSPAQIEQLRASIREFGFTNPILIDESCTVIAGHGRIAAAKLEGIVDLPAIELHGLTKAQKRALVIADNQLALKSQWNVELLTFELEQLQAADFDLSLVGFEPFELNELMSTANDPNAAWRGMPSFSQEDQLGFRTLVVHFKDAAAVADFKRRIEQEFTDKARFIWHPFVPNDAVAHLGYVSEDAAAAAK